MDDREEYVPPLHWRLEVPISFMKLAYFLTPSGTAG